MSHVYSKLIHIGKIEVVNIKQYKDIKAIWPILKLTISETSTPWETVDKPGGTVTIIIIDTIPRITNSGEDNDLMGRWLYISIGGKKNHQVTIINTYRPCKQSDETGISTSTI